MGGNSQWKDFEDLDKMLDYIKGQIEGVNSAGMSLTIGEIKQEYHPDSKKFTYHWEAYFE